MGEAGEGGREIGEDVSSSDGIRVLIDSVGVCVTDESKLLIRYCVTNSSHKKNKKRDFFTLVT